MFDCRRLARACKLGHQARNLGNNLLPRLIFDISFAVRFAELPYGAKLARSRPEDIMVAKEILQGDPRPKVSEFVESISKIANDRDEAAFDALFRYFAPRIKSYCLRLGVHMLLAQRKSQEAMVSIWRNAAQFDLSKASPSTWIFTISGDFRRSTFTWWRRARISIPAKLAIGSIRLARTRSVRRAPSFGGSFTRFAAGHQPY
jgi:hypothetical protein